MMRRSFGAAFVLATASAVAALANAQQAATVTARDLVGTWTPVSILPPVPGGFVENTLGTMMFGSDSRVALIFARNDLPKFASNNRASGTPDENRAIVQGSIGFFGVYAVEDAGKTLVLRIEGSTFPNWTGAEQRRALALNGDELVYTVPGPRPNDAPLAQVTLRRMKSGPG